MCYNIFSKVTLCVWGSYSSCHPDRLVGYVYGISTLVVYLMANPFNTYIHTYIDTWVVKEYLANNIIFKRARVHLLTHNSMVLSMIIQHYKFYLILIILFACV